jgi:indolepyruvate ferredoxin oxidoreductase
VKVRKNRYPAVNFLKKTELSSSQISIKDFVMIPPHTSQKEATLAARYEKMISMIRQKGLNRFLNFDERSSVKYSLAFITSGSSFCYLEHALFEMGLSGKFPILKLGMTHPLDAEGIENFIARAGTVIVVEEKRPFLESQIRSILQKAAQTEPVKFEGVRIYGKNFPQDLPGIPEVRGLNASLLIEILGSLFLKLDLPELQGNKVRIESEVEGVRETASPKFSIPSRTPTFCPGCPHRDSATVSLKIKKELGDVIFHGESGCHSMLQFAPNEGLMQNYSGMGLGGGTGAGIDPYIKNKQVVFLGDSTFFHSGMVAVSDSIKNNQDITYVILDNKTTAMTGHQPTPGNDFDILGRATFAQKIEDIVRGMTGGSADIPVVRANPEDREPYAKLLKEMAARAGVKIVIADKECGITFQRRLKKEKKAELKAKGFHSREEFINISTDVCEYCLECTRATGCPGLTVEATDFGPKIATDLSSCVSDGACAKGKVCPSFEKIMVTRVRSPQKKLLPDLSSIPLPVPTSFNDVYYISTFAVGGMGAGVVSAVLVRAGIQEGYQVHFLDKKGLAIRNGGVFGHIIFSKDKDQTLSPIVPYGKADLILGIDVLETARGLDPKHNMRVASSDRTAAIVNTHKTETVLSLMGTDAFDPAELEKIIRSGTRGGGYLGKDFSAISQKIFGTKLYVNILLLGAAFQKGFLPVSLENLLSALESSVPKADREENLSAFHLGRKIAVEGAEFLPSGQVPKRDYAVILNEKSEILKKRFIRGRWLARKYREMMEQAARWMDMPALWKEKIAVRVYELIQYGGRRSAEKYLAMVWDVYRKDRKDLGLAATLAVIENLFKVTAIKDEVYVAHLLTSQEKLSRDRERYGVDPANGDRIRYTHLNRPQFTILGFNLEFDLHTKNWMLNIMKHCRFLRGVLPGWHHRENDFRDWYEGLVKNFNYFEDSADYKTYVEALKCPEQVNGYRSVRYPKMEWAQSRAEQILKAMGFPSETLKELHKNRRR